MYIDGFTAGQLPPKASIREIRINQNPYAAEFARPGRGRIEIAQVLSPRILVHRRDHRLRLRSDRLAPARGGASPFLKNNPMHSREPYVGEGISMHVNILAKVK